MRKAFTNLFTAANSSRGGAAGSDSESDDGDELWQPPLERSESSRNAKETLMIALTTKGMLASW
jgi:hypothetical protein